MFKEFNSMQYIAIDISNCYGLDKLTHEDRIKWVKSNIHDLETLSVEAEEPILYNKAVRALRESQKGIPTNHSVALDAINSGTQIMSAVMGCMNGCALTGLVHQDVRSDSYTSITQTINDLLKRDGYDEVTISRSDAKSAIMKGGYGSKKVPNELFGDLVDYYYEAMGKELPGATMLMSMLTEAWDSTKTFNKWVLPDGHVANVAITETVEKKIHVESLKYTPVVLIEELVPQEKSVSLLANTIQSLDGYVLRTMNRRCNYSPRMLTSALEILKSTEYNESSTSPYSELWEANKIADLVMIIDLTEEVASSFPEELNHKLISMIEMSLSHKPFAIINIHDSFACHANNCNQLRRTYAHILADLCDSTVIDNILNQLYGDIDSCPKLSDTKQLAAIIRESNYGLT